MAIGSFFLLARDRALWLAAIVSSLGFVVLLAIFDFESGWDFDTLEYTDLWTVEGALRNLLPLQRTPPVVPWAAFFLVGMWLGRLDLRDDWLRQWLLYSALGVAIGIELLSIAIVGGLTADYPQSSDEVEDIQAVFGTGPIPPMPQYLLAGGATAIVVICTSVAATARRPRARWATPFIATGQMALTLYLAHGPLGDGAARARRAPRRPDGGVLTAGRGHLFRGRRRVLLGVAFALRAQPARVGHAQSCWLTPCVRPPSSSAGLWARSPGALRRRQRLSVAHVTTIRARAG